MTKALYRKYRPQTLDAVIGEPQVTDALKNALKTGHISHAYLFTGPRGTGKTSVARIFAHAINQFDYQLEDSYIDIIEVDAASHTGVDNIRELREKAIIAPTQGKYKVYIIDEVHMLSKSAFNALLKTLEEPPAHTVFIMATTDAYKVPVTIISRAQTFTFKLVDPKTISIHLSNICQKEKITIDPDALQIIAERSGGSFRDSLSLLDQISTLTTQTITKALVVDALGLPTSTKITELLDFYLQQDIVKITTSFQDFLVSGLKPETLASEMINTILTNLQPQFLPLLKTLPTVHAPFAEAKLLTSLIPSTNIPTPTSTKTPHLAPQTSSPPSSHLNPTPSQSFQWDNFLTTVASTNDLIAKQLTHTPHTFSNHTLHLYPAKKITKTILTRNRSILTTALPNAKIIIHEPTPSATHSDPLISQISDIMGKVEEENGGEHPF